MPILIPAPEQEALTDEVARFLAVSWCADGVRMFTVERYGSEGVSAGLAAELAGRMPPRDRRPLGVQAERLLRVAWQSELAARLSEGFDEPTLRRAMTHTLPVNAYYALFSALRALNVARGNPTQQHHGIHKDFALGGINDLPLPWSASLTGDPERVQDCHVGPTDWFVPSAIDPIDGDHPPEAYLFASLRMTRKWKMEQARGAWLRRARRPNGQRYKILPAVYRAELAATQWRTTLLDFVYELRRRANYQHADEYMAQTDDLAVKKFHDGLLFLTDSGLLLTETKIASFVGVQALRSCASDWANRIGQGIGSWAVAAVQHRIEVIGNCVSA